MDGGGNGDRELTKVIKMGWFPRAGIHVHFVTNDDRIIHAHFISFISFRKLEGSGGCVSLEVRARILGQSESRRYRKWPQSNEETSVCEMTQLDLSLALGYSLALLHCKKI